MPANPVIRDEVTPLLPVYDLDVRRDAFWHLFRRYSQRTGRVGWSEVGTSGGGKSSRSLSTHFIETFARGDAAREKEFLIKLVAYPCLAERLKTALALAKKYLPKREFQDPELVLLLNGKNGNAKMIGRNAFAVNCNHLWLQFRHLSLDSALEKAVEEIESLCSHEASHGFMNQAGMRRSKSVHWLYDVAFREGHAVLSEKTHLIRHFDYMNEINFWVKALNDLCSAENKEDSLSVLERLCESPALQKHQPDTVEKIRAACKKREFNSDLLSEIFVERYGPAYHVGYHFWKTVLDARGIECVRSLAVKGPVELLAEFNSISP